jgi:hypothetical protein
MATRGNLAGKTALVTGGLISSKDRKQPTPTRSSSRQQLRTHGDRAELSVSIIDGKPNCEA